MLYEDIIKEFNEQSVKFIIVGGVAFNLLGGMRATQDLDIIVKMEDKNLNKVINILLKKGYKVKQPVDPMDFSRKDIRESWIKDKHMKAFNFYKSEISYEEVDIVIDSPVNFEQGIKNAKTFKLDNLRMKVISIDDLIKMKRASAREQDKFDIKELKMIKKFKR